MAGYLLLKDYATTIQDRMFNQLVQNDYAKRSKAENAALDIVISHITQKYNVNAEFFTIDAWNPTKEYNIRDRVVIDYDAWVASTAYAINDCVIHSGIGYVCATANSDATFTIGKWNAIGAQYAIYYAAFPATCRIQGKLVTETIADPIRPMFDVYRNYYKGDVVYWENNTYECVTATANVSPKDLKQYYVYANVPVPNVFPDDTINNANYQYWKEGVPVNVPAGRPPTNKTYWVLGDNRNPQLLECTKHITIWILSELIVTNNRPAVWEDNYRTSLERLKGFAEGKTTLRIPLIQPNAGKRVRYGGAIKLNNTY